MNGLELSNAYFLEAVQPILDARLPGLAFSAARLDSGSDVLGFDDETSQDHAHSARFVDALHEAIESDEVRSLPRNIGAVWQFADSTDILSSATRSIHLATIYQPEENTT